MIFSLVCLKGAWVGAVENAASSSPASGASHPHFKATLVLLVQSCLDCKWDAKVSDALSGP